MFVNNGKAKLFVIICLFKSIINNIKTDNKNNLLHNIDLIFWRFFLSKIKRLFLLKKISINNGKRIINDEILKEMQHIEVIKNNFRLNNVLYFLYIKYRIITEDSPKNKGFPIYCPKE